MFTHGTGRTLALLLGLVSLGSLIVLGAAPPPNGATSGVRFEVWAPIVNTPAAGVAAIQITSTPTVTPVPAAIPVFADDPFQAIPIDGVPHTIPGNSATWYKFDYGGNAAGRPIVNLRLPNGVVTGVGFEVWDSDKIRDFWEQKPVGRGTQEVITGCHPAPEPTAEVEGDEATPTPEPAPGDHCPTNDLTWKGAFGGAGTFYVRVVNPNSGPADYVLLMN